MSLTAHGLVHSHTPLPFRLLGLAHALAEHHNVESGCFPKLATLAERGETNERSVRRMLAELEERGVIRRIPTRDSAGRQISNSFEFLPGVSILSGGEDISVRGGEDTGVLPINSNKETIHSLRECCGPEDRQCPPPLEEKKTRLNGRCPYTEIRALWIEILPECSEPLPVENWTPARKQRIRARWNDQLPSLDHWRRTFEYVRQSPFLMGKISREGRRPFKVTIWWVTKPENLSEIYEGKYEDG